MGIQFPWLDDTLVACYQILFVRKKLSWIAIKFRSLENSFGGLLSNSLRLKKLSLIAINFFSCTKRSGTAIELFLFVNTFLD